MTACALQNTPRVGPPAETHAMGPSNGSRRTRFFR